MILKSYIIEKNLSPLDKIYASLFYGENIGLKDEIKEKITERYKKDTSVRFKNTCCKSISYKHPFYIFYVSIYKDLYSLECIPGVSLNVSFLYLHGCILDIDL